MWRQATDEDLVALRDLERAANLEGLAHVFPPDRFPFPDDDVLARWALVLEDPAVTVVVRDSPDRPRLDLFAAYDDTTLRHLAVHPSRWGEGLASAAIRSILAALAGRGSAGVDLWCLAANLRARRLYEHLGWAPTGEARPAPWPPYPTELRLHRPIQPTGPVPS